MSKIEKFMKKNGVDAKSVNVGKYSTKFCSAMVQGLVAEQENVPMFLSYLEAKGEIEAGKKAAVIDAGGTNYRVGLISFEDDKCNIEYVKKYLMPGTESEVTWDEFISFAAECLEPIVDQTENIGFCFSYPGEITPEKDCKVISMAKQVQINGCEGQYIGASLNAELKKRGHGDKNIVVVNDTTATLMYGYAARPDEQWDGYIGLVAGTGINICCEVPKREISKAEVGTSGRMIINTEAASFDGFPRGTFMKELDKKTVDKGKAQAEKMISGYYLGKLCYMALKDAADSKLFSKKAGKYIKKIESFETPDADEWARGNVPEEFTKDDTETALYIIDEMFERAARCVAAMLCGTMLLSGQGIEGKVCIAVDGSLYTKSKLFSKKLEKQMKKNAEKDLGRKYEFVTGEETSLIGTAAAVLLN